MNLSATGSVARCRSAMAGDICVEYLRAFPSLVYPSCAMVTRIGSPSRQSPSSRFIGLQILLHLMESATHRGSLECFYLG